MQKAKSDIKKVGYEKPILTKEGHLKDITARISIAIT
jgi:hypothetical protein